MRGATVINTRNYLQWARYVRL